MDVISRKEAKILGLRLYFTGILCPTGHIAKRYVTNYCCVECNKIHTIKHKKNNPEYRLSRPINHVKRKEWRNNNKEKIKTYNNKFKQNNPQYNKQWHNLHPEKRAEYKLKRKLNIKQATPLWYEKELVGQVYLKCSELSKQWNMILHVDHVVPLAGKNVCGLHCWNNLQIIEATINQTKSNKFEE